MTMQKVILKQGKEKSVLQRHPWVFSGAIATVDADDGAMVPLCSYDGTVIAWGYYNSRTQIAMRLLTFSDTKPDDDLIARRLLNAYALRVASGVVKGTNAFRMVHSEGDMLPGLIADWYNGHCVVQFLTSGMDRLKGTIVQIIQEKLQPFSIYERSDHEGRKMEGLPEVHAQLHGQTPDFITINEHGMEFYVDVIKGQKTGFYCDQRDNRLRIQSIANGKDVLNLFAYSGGFSVAALMGGAIKAVSVDSSGYALAIAQKNCELNNVSKRHAGVKADVFDYINTNDIPQNVIICDPPALIKSKSAIQQGLRGYNELNVKIFKKVPPLSFVLTCSCSRFVDMKLFQKIVFSAARDAGREVTITGKYLQPADHPVSIYCPETEYLKAIMVFIS